jgi:uncharacterized membrane protein SirB2
MLALQVSALAPLNMKNVILCISGINLLYKKQVVPFTPQFHLPQKMLASLLWPITGILRRTTSVRIPSRDRH